MGLFNRKQKKVELKQETQQEVSITTQNKAVREALESGELITAFWAVNKGIYRLSARIYDLKKKGLQISSKYARSESGANYKIYYLAG